MKSAFKLNEQMPSLLEHCHSEADSAKPKMKNKIICM